MASDKTSRASDYCVLVIQPTILSSKQSHFRRLPRQNVRREFYSSSVCAKSELDLLKRRKGFIKTRHFARADLCPSCGVEYAFKPIGDTSDIESCLGQLSRLLP